MRGLGVAAIAFWLLASTTATAASVKVSFHGILSRGIDSAGLTGADPTNLAGVAFSLTYRFDVFAPGGFTFDDGFTQAAGGPPAASAVIRIGNFTWIVDSLGWGYYKTDALGKYYPTGPVDEVWAELFGQVRGTGETAYMISNLYSNDVEYIPTYDILTPIDYKPPETLLGSFGFHVYDDSVIAEGSRITRVTIAPVPEPATWALMIGGFGIAGTALRRRRLSSRALVCSY